MGIKLVVISGKQTGMEIPVKGPKFYIGRGEGCHLRSHSHTISRKHCVIRIDNSSATIEDCGSTNGTIINGEKIQEPCPIRNGDRITVGKLELEVRLPAGVEEVQKTEVHAVGATVHAAPVSPPSSDDLEISKWLSEDNDDDHANVASAKKQIEEQPANTIHDTIVNQPTDDTTTNIPIDPNLQKEKKPAVTVSNRFKQPVKPKADSSRSAAEEMLKQFFPGKKS
jgi:predicted component of type VI protein secretion system